MAIPMYLLYEAGLLCARFLFPDKIAIERRKPNSVTAADSSRMWDAADAPAGRFAARAQSCDSRHSQ
jgi:hypothetical protein